MATFRTQRYNKANNVRKKTKVMRQAVRQVVPPEAGVEADVTKGIESDAGRQGRQLIYNR